MDIIGRRAQEKSILHMYDGEKSSETYTMEAKFGYILQGKNHIPSS